MNVVSGLPGNSSPRSNEVIELKVGAKAKSLFTSSDTLAKLPDAKRAIIDNAPIHKEKPEPGRTLYRPFIARNYGAVKAVLEYLHGGGLPPTCPKIGWEALREEANFWGLEKLEEEALSRMKRLPFDKDNQWEWVKTQLRVADACLAAQQWEHAYGFYKNTSDVVDEMSRWEAPSRSALKQAVDHAASGLAQCIQAQRKWAKLEKHFSLGELIDTKGHIHLSPDTISLVAECYTMAGKPDVAEKLRKAAAGQSQGQPSPTAPNSVESSPATLSGSESDESTSLVRRRKPQTLKEV